MNTALLIIDVQNDYFPGGTMTLAGTAEASTNVARLLARFRELGLPVIHVQHIASDVKATFFLPGTKGAEIHESVTPRIDETVIEKHYPNGFRETRLLDHLQANQIKTLVITGMMTHMCVDSTTRAACDLGFSIQLAHDACATKALAFDGAEVSASDVQSAYVAALNGSFAEVMDTDEILSRLPAG